VWNCSIEDGFVYGIAPDEKGTRSSGFQLPELKPAPWWTYCAQCLDFVQLGGDVVSNPAPFLTLDPVTREALVWGAEGGRTTDELSILLRDALADAALLWLPASEPAGLTNDRSAPRAFVLAADGSAILGWPSATATGLDFVSFEQPTPLTPRAGFAAAWSRTALALFVAGGVDATGAVQQDAWIWRPAASAAAAHAVAVGTGGGGVWSRAVMPHGLAPVDARAAAFSHRDWRLWVVDGAGSTARLLRIDPATGAVEAAALGLLTDLEQVWLTAMPDGRVLLAGRIVGGARFRLALLGSAPFVVGSPVSVLSVLEGPGALGAMPQVRGGLVSLAFEQAGPDGVGALRIGSITESELEALGSGGKLTVCHIPPGKPAKARPLRIPPSALGAHLGHGDMLGECFPVATWAGG